MANVIQRPSFAIAPQVSDVVTGQYGLTPFASPAQPAQSPIPATAPTTPAPLVNPMTPPPFIPGNTLPGGGSGLPFSQDELFHLGYGNAKFS